MNRTLKRLSLVGLIASAAFGLAACGVKGGLEPPASAAAEAQPAAADAPRGTGETRTVAIPGAGIVGQPTTSVDARGTASTGLGTTPAATQRSVLDWFID